MTSAIAILAATEISTDLNDWMQLVPFPDEVSEANSKQFLIRMINCNALLSLQFRYKLIATMVLDFGLAWLVEQIVSSFFSDNKPKESLLLD